MAVSRLNLPLVSWCPQRKVRHSTFEAAMAEVVRREGCGDHQPERGVLHPYWCRPCLAWHTGHNQKPDEEQA